MQVLEFAPGKQTKGTLLFDRLGNVVEVAKDIKNAQALPSVGTNYKLVMTAAEYAEYLKSQEPETPLDYAGAAKLLEESPAIPHGLKRVLGFLLGESQKKPDLLDGEGKIADRYLRNYDAVLIGTEVVFEPLTDEEAAKRREEEKKEEPDKPQPPTGSITLDAGKTYQIPKTGKVVITLRVPEQDVFSMRFGQPKPDYQFDYHLWKETGGKSVLRRTDGLPNAWNHDTRKWLGTTTYLVTLDKTIRFEMQGGFGTKVLFEGERPKEALTLKEFTFTGQITTLATL